LNVSIASMDGRAEGVAVYTTTSLRRWY
jgi:hypothetical protein